MSVTMAADPSIVGRARDAACRFEPAGFEEAVGLLRQALLAEPGDPSACAVLAETYAYWGFRREVSGMESQSYYDLALTYAERAVESAPRSSEAHRALSVALRRGERADAGRRRAEAHLAVDLAADDADAWCELWRAGGYELSDPAIKKALELRPRFFAALHDLGVSLCEHGRLEESRRFLERAVACSPGTVLGRYNLAMVLHRQGDSRAALAELRSLAQRCPDEPLITDGLASIKEALRGAPAA